MSWESYYKEICKAKDEYEQTIKPALEIFKQVQKNAWDEYIIKLKQAEILLTEEN